MKFPRWLSGRSEGKASKPNPYCSFCRRSYRDVGPLVEGPHAVYLCGDCIALCQSILDHEKARRGVLGRAVRLRALAHGRSGDKGNHANIGIAARSEAAYCHLNDVLTADRVADYFRHLGPSRVVRYELPNLLAFNFVLYDVLDGGASRSLRLDSQGKTLALQLLEMELAAPESP